jgi:hypothetical protein
MLLIDRIEELRLTFKELNRLADEIDTRTASEELYQTVFQAFTLLQPFSWKSLEVMHVTKKSFSRNMSGYGHNEIDNEDIIVNNWVGLRNKGAWRSNRAYPINDRTFFFNVIKEYGSEIAEKVRGPIKGDFLDLHYQIKELEDYSSLLLSLQFDSTFKTCDSSRYGYKAGAPIFSIPIYGITFETNAPRDVYLLKTKIEKPEDIKKNYDNGINLTEFQDMHKIEQIKDELMKLYKEASVTVTKTKDHNDPIFKEISKITSAYDFAKAIKHKRDY